MFFRPNNGGPKSGSGIGVLSYLGSTFFIGNECIDGCINRRIGNGILIREKEFNDKLGLWSLLLKIGLELGFEEMVGGSETFCIQSS